MMMKPFLLRSLLALCVGSATWAQTFTPSVTPDQPMPDIPYLMHEVEEHQRAAESIQKNYLYHEAAREERDDGKKSETREFDVFYLEGLPVHKLTRKNGKDLTPDEQRKESERIDKEIVKAKKRKAEAESKGKQTDRFGNDEVTVSRFLELGSFSNPRRIKLNGRETIAIDYAGDPKAKTRNRTEEVIHVLAGTIWVDEQDRTITRMEGQFANPFKLAGGLFLSIKKGTNFSVEMTKINNEVWLPARIEGHGTARVLLFVNFSGSALITYSDYRKFKATSTILPGYTTQKETSEPGPSDQPQPSASPR